MVAISREKLLIIAVQAIEAVGMVIFFKLLAVTLDKSELGNYLLVTSILSLLLICPFSVLDQGLMRFASIYSKAGVLQHRYPALLFGYGLIALVIATVLWISGTFILNSPRWSIFLPALAFWLAAEAFKNVTLAMSNALRMRIDYATGKIVEQLTKLSLVFVLATMITLDTLTIIHVLTVSGIVVMCIMLFYQRKQLGTFSKNDLLAVFRDTGSFSWPLLVWGIFGWMQLMSNRWFLDWFLDEQAVADFGVLSTISTLPFTMLVGLVATYSLPVLYQRENENSGSTRRNVQIILYRMSPVFLIGVVVTAILHKEIILLVSSSAYLSHSIMLPFMVFSVALSSLGTFLTYDSYARLETHKLLVSQVAPGIVSVFLGLVLVSKFGVVGAAITFIIAHSLYFLLQLGVFYRNGRNIIVENHGYK